MKKKYILLAGLLFAAASTMNSCLDFDDPGSELGINDVQTDDTKHTGNVDSIPYLKEITADGAAEAYETLVDGQYFGSALTAIYNMRGSKDGKPSQAHAYQMQYSLGTDLYAQYFTVPHNDFPYSETVMTSTYHINDKFIGGAYGCYSDAKFGIIPLLQHPAIDSIPEIKAIFLLYYCIAAQEMADLSGPFTYLEDKKGIEDVTEYDDVRTIYYGIEENLNTIVECLKHFDSRPDDYKHIIKSAMKQYCKTNHAENYTKDDCMDSYIRLANSLKLRMAMHIVKVEPATAQRWAEEAVAGGVIEDVGQQHGLFPKNTGMENFESPFVTLSKDWHDVVLSASFESLLMSLNHPYSKYLFAPNSGDIKNKRTGEVLPAKTRICGVRSGTLVGKGQYDPATNPYLNYSEFDPTVITNIKTPKYFIKWAEVDFLRAEGLIRGWKTGDENAERGAEFYYYRGIDNAFFEEPTGGSQYTAYVGDYKDLPEAIDYISVDPLGEGPDWQSVTTIGVKWNEGDSQETKLEKIITQKYLALFPLSNEAWTELRRTGYPKLFPVLNPDEGDGSIEEGDMIRRIPWWTEDPIAKAMIKTSGIPALGNLPNEQATRLWWDVDTEDRNF